jgi:thioredoxin-related protein
MRNLSLVLLLILIGAGIYGYANNPAACRKLGTDAVADLTAIFTPGSATTTNSPSASVASNGPNTSNASAPAAPPVADTAPAKHWQQGFVTQQSGTMAAAAPIIPVAVTSTPRTYTDNDFTDYGEALNASQARNRPMLILFTGSDWCPYCQALQSEVLSSNEFQQYINSHFVFLTVDELRNTPVMDDEKKRVADLEQKFGPSGFPSLLVVSSDEKTIGRISGYAPGSGPTSVIDGLDKFLHK